MRDQTLVIIPTYNEKENILFLLQELEALVPEVHVLVVDDSSPDGTSDIVKKYAEGKDKIHLLRRPRKDGLGPAYLDGFRWSQEKNYAWVVQMDADLSHRPQDLVQIIKQAGSADLILGSRYVKGGKIRRWKWHRRALSYYGNAYARFFLGARIRDWTSGFMLWQNSKLSQIDLSQIGSNGYAFQIELKHRAMQAGLRIKEVPIVFADVREGQSKMNAKIAFEALYQVAFLGLKSLM